MQGEKMLEQQEVTGSEFQFLFGGLLVHDLVTLL
jgi:hypothetical protein